MASLRLLVANLITVLCHYSMLRVIINPALSVSSFDLDPDLDLNNTTNNTSEEEWTHYIRRPEQFFPKATPLFGRVVSCDEPEPSGENLTYPAETWTCYNISVDAQRIRHWYIEGWGQSSCDDGEDSYDNRNDISAICRAMLEAQGVDKALWTTFVSGVSCANSTNNRVILTLHDGSYVWETVFPGKGFFTTLRCMAEN